MSEIQGWPAVRILLYPINQHPAVKGKLVQLSENSHTRGIYQDIDPQQSRKKHDR